jgi:pyruvate,water dikinase
VLFGGLLIGARRAGSVNIITDLAKRANEDFATRKRTAHIIHGMQNANEILWTSAFLNERFIEPVSPLGWSFVGALFQEFALRDPLRYMGYPDADALPATRLWRGQPFVNVALFQIFYKPFPDALVPADAVRYFPNGDVNFRKGAPYPHSRYSARFLLSLARHLLRDARNASPLNYRHWQKFVAYHDAQTQNIRARLDAANDARELLNCIAELYDLDAQLLSIHRWSLTYADLLYKILAQWTGDLAPALMSGVPNKTREVNAQLTALAQRPAPLNADLLRRIQTHAPLSDAEQETALALQAFLDAHGHRAFSLDLAHPNFRDDPTQLLPLLYANSADSCFQGESLWRAYAEARRKLRWWQRMVLRPIIGLARRYAQLREDQRYYWQKSLALTRRAYLRIAALGAAQALVAAPQDIFYATRQEIEAYVRGEMDASFLRARIAARQMEWRAYWQDYTARGAAATPHFLRGDVPVFENKSHVAETNVWRGRGVSPGMVRGVARIVRDPRDLGRVGAGEILVAPSTDPAWTSVFARLGGLILERGGVLSHGAVVAREYELPAVAAVAEITRVLCDGDWIELDGTSGAVKRINL